MRRSDLIKLHLYVAAFLVPFLFIMSLSGVLELLGVDGEIYKTVIHTTKENTLDFNSPTIKRDVENLLIKINANSNFKKIRIKDNKLYTRPNYTTHYAFKKENGLLKIYEYQPSIQFKLMSLHKGNGPDLYQLYQQIFVYGLFFVLLSGLWLGITAKALRSKTLGVFIVGTVFFIILINL